MSANNYADGGHRPHARHDGETPRNEIKEAPYHLTVTLDSWGPVDNLFPAIYDALQANWGDAPSRKVDELLFWNEQQVDSLTAHDRTGWESLTPQEKQYVESCFARKTLQQVLERITFSFLVDGCTRACTHQLVRSRIGSAMMQHGGRDNDWRHRPWVMPETIRRACILADGAVEGLDDVLYQKVDNKAVELKSCIADWKPIDTYLHTFKKDNLRHAIRAYLEEGRHLYAALVDAGIPWEDARRVLWMGTATYIHIDYNYIAFRDMQANRLEHIMDWEINCVAQLMQREVRMKCPPLLSKYLGSHSDIAGQAKFAGLQSWPPDGKYPNPFGKCVTCGHPAANHEPGLPNTRTAGMHKCEICERSSKGAVWHPMEVIDTLLREHRPEQNPFWVLHPDSMAGGPIVWIPTNGVYPHDVIGGKK